ncbi:MAG: hypothetical protein VX288_02265 [Planctomycetota bacterium]|nr:hypothetical protein [Planctomycetota bacterium]
MRLGTLVFTLVWAVCAALTSPTKAVDVQELDDDAWPPSEVINVIGPLPTYDARTVGNFVGVDLLDATFTAVLDFDAKLAGEREVIWESGGGTIGFSFVYEAPNLLVLRASGNGGFSLATATFPLPSAVIESGAHDVAWTFDIDNGEGLQAISIIIDGFRVVSTSSQLQGDWSGSNAASFGAASSNFSGTGANTVLTGAAFTSGMIDLDAGLSFYPDMNYAPESFDDDGDGILDGWEFLYVPGDLGVLGEGDADKDGLPDVGEFEAGTDPTAADSDGDGLADGAEVEIGSNPLVTDSDGDGLDDGDEVNEHGSDPTLVDTDGDGADDGREVAEGFDPADPQSVPPVYVEELDDPHEMVNFLGAMASYHNRDLGSGPVDRLDVTFTLPVVFADKTDGERELIFESGGGWTGLSLCYEATNTVVLRNSGNGINPAGILEAGWAMTTIRYPLPGSLVGDEVELAWVVDVSNGEGLQEISLIVNGYRVASEALDLGGDWSGGNGAALGTFSSGFAGSGARSDLSGIDFISGEILVDRGLYFYSDTNYRPPVTDSDEDGLPDEWEFLYTLGDLGTLGDGDADGDGLADAGEFDELTDPTLADTDGDGLEDGAELENGSDPRNPDTDGDLLDDGEEAEAGTDPNNPDTDEDGFTDRREVDAGTDPTNPNDSPGEFTTQLGLPTEVINLPGILPTNNVRNFGAGPIDLLDVTLTAVIDFSAKLDGPRELIWESGGGWTGLSICYEAPNILVLRHSGNGINPAGVLQAGWGLTTARFQLPPALVDSGDVEVAWVCDVLNGDGEQEIRLVINGYPVDSDALDLGGDWSGGNGAAFAVVGSGFAGTGERTDLTGMDFVSGVINLEEGLKLYSDINYLPETTDSDGDALPDEWESLYAPGDLGVLGEGDADEDGLSDAAELDGRTDPTLQDTDGDGLDDGDEIENKTDPLDPDSDDDGLADSDEVNGDPATDPNNPDTDEDGLSDAVELAAGSDPTDPGSPVVLADSVADWADDGEQGVNNWFYGYYNLTLDDDFFYSEDDLIEFVNDFGPAGGVVSPGGNHWTGAQWDLLGEALGPWTMLGREETHPNGGNSEPFEEHWTIRRWVSDRDSVVALIWHMRKTSSGGDGVTGYLFVNGEEVDTASIAGSDVEGVMRSQVVSLQEGDVVDLALTPIGPDGGATDSSDGSANWLKVTEVSGDVEPIAAACSELEISCEALAEESVVRVELTGSPDGCNCQSIAVFIDDQPAGVFDAGEGGIVDVPLPEGCGDGSVHALEVACRTRLGRLGISAFCEFTCGEPVGPAAPRFRRGDADDNGALQLTDGIYILNFLFLGGSDPVCGDAADADNNGAIQLTDGIFILNFLFLGGQAPAQPGLECGEDTEQPDDGLGCETFSSCA